MNTPGHETQALYELQEKKITRNKSHEKKTRQIEYLASENLESSISVPSGAGSW
jgi:hypothetical protein